MHTPKRIIQTIALSLFFSLSIFAQTNISLQHIDTKGYAVRVVFKDANNIMWLGTTSGLLSFPQLNSSEPNEYKRHIGNLNMSIKSINGDNKGCLWIKTIYNYNYYYDPQTNLFIEDTPTMLSSKGIHINSEFTTLSNKDGNTYIWTDNCLYTTSNDSPKISTIKFNADEQLQNVRFNKDNITVLSLSTLYLLSHESNQITKSIPLPKDFNFRNHLFLANNNTPWIWSSNKVFKYINGKWNIALQTTSDITDIIQDKKQRIWISTQSNGIYICNENGDVVSHLLHHPDDANSLLSNHIESLFFEDTNQTIWIAYTKGGLSVSSDNIPYLQQHKITDTSDKESQTDVLSFASSKIDSSLWIGLEGRGVWRKTKQEITNIIDKGSAISLFTDDDGSLWAGLYKQGLTHISNDGNKKTYLHDSSPYSIAKDKNGNIYVALLGKGVWLINTSSDEVTDTHIKPKYVFDLKYYQQKLYAASTEGLCVKQEEHDWELLLNGRFNYLTIDNNGYIYLIGSEGSEGLTILDPKGNTLEVPDKLKNTPLKTIAINKDGIIWTTSPSEIFMISLHLEQKEKLKFYSFKLNNHNKQTFYNTHTTLIDNDGLMWLGTSTGYQSVDTRKLSSYTKEHSYKQPLVISSISINNKVISPNQLVNGRTILNSDILFTRELYLKHKENNLIIECSLPLFEDYTSNTYYYQLKGLTDVWHPIDRHNIILSNLPYGSYQLLTKTLFSNTNTLLTIHIEPPFWLSWKAICIYLILLTIITYIIIRFFHNRHKYKRQLYELQQQKEQQSQINELKLRFFTNISHDIRTPLSLIIGPLEEILKSSDKKTKTLLEVVHRNALLLLSLVNQILDFRRLEMNKETFIPSYGDIVSLLNEICLSFQQKAKKEHIKFVFQPDIERVETVFDRDKTTKIMMNLLSNAFKFTPSGGEITVQLNISHNTIIISVADTGIGISDIDKIHIFDRFYQSSHNNQTSIGSGIGLHIVREYVKLQGGNITVNDNTSCNHGSVFQFTIPLQKIKENTPQIDTNDMTPLDCINNSIPSIQQITTNTSLPTLLVIDDNKDLLYYISQSLNKEYNILTATNGNEAILLLKEKDIDIIISDVMMPEMNGLELCEYIKTDINTSHIPIILLTAKTMTDDELKGLEAGADDYIIKPFSIDILSHRIHNIFERCRKQHEQFANAIDVKPSDITVTPIDKEFISKAIAIVETHIAEPDFTVEDLSNEMGIHRAQLYKKLLHLTGKTPQQFIRILRLKRGKQLLDQSGLYVSEIAYKVGFNSPRIFSKYFKDEFGITPNEYSKHS